MVLILPERVLAFLVRPRIARNWMQGWGYMVRTLALSFGISSVFYAVLPLEAPRSIWQSAQIAARDFSLRAGFESEERVQERHEALTRGEAVEGFDPRATPPIDRRQLIQAFSTDLSLPTR